MQSPRQRFNISRLAIRYSWLTVCFWLIVAVAGLFAFSSLKYALLPEVAFPVVLVNAKAPLTSVNSTEDKLTKPLEQSLSPLDNLKELSSSTYAGQGVITVLFDSNISLNTATDRVKQAIASVALPPQASFEVIPFNLNESSAIAYVIKSKSKNLGELRELAKKEIIPMVENLPGVLKVNLLGDGAFTEVKNPGNFQTLVRFNGENALSFEVIKRGDANTLDVVDKVGKAIDSLYDHGKNLGDVQIILAQTQANYIREANFATIEALLGAIVLAVLIIFSFLRNFAATLITAVAIPISLLGTFIVMAIFGFNLETITLLALALVIGIVVDDAIVDVENIARHIDEGETPKQAAIHGTDEIGLSVSASTLTIIAVFLPVGLMGGTVGQFFQPFGITVSAAVFTSLLVARTLSPVLAMYWLKPGKQPKSNQTRKTPLWINSYRNLLQWSLNHRYQVVGIALVSLIAGIALIPLIPQGFIPKLDRGEFNITYTTPLPKIKLNKPTENNTTTNSDSFDWLGNLAQSPKMFLLWKTRRIGEEIEKTVLSNSEVESVYTIVGARGVPTKGKIYVKLKGERTLNTFEVEEKIRSNLPTISGVNISIEEIPFVNTESEKKFQVALLGDKIQNLQQVASDLKTRIEGLPGFLDLSLTGSESVGDTIIKIERLDQKPVIYLSANLDQSQAIGNATEQVRKEFESLSPQGIRLKLWGESAQSNAVLDSFGGTLILSVLSIVFVLLLLFRRLLEPIVVLLSLPLSVVGAMLGLLLTQSDFGMVSLIGIIFLLGLVDKNAILLMDYANQLRQLGKKRTDAILETGIVRLRPIIMTTASTILGMLPIALGLGAGAELRQPMAVAIIGGLITSTLLSLIVVPVLYTLTEDLWFRGVRC
jgi:multidrug efflux pump subunit AcrB